ncbi:hypothetical protein [Vibrio aestuarianus]|uniref:Uncharacterized protein n=1 Tax=Vibrio aestuarianus TaxID=28171 RepID=A0ABD7YSB2_9VIBR|nr:hypothetical protein [Vibrio aestuarianus]WGK87313.1 hypothetical protein PYE67_14410 [Vibrio aestuarianus]WGK87465.1 hypothetical protein PYE67_15235 [Vibrio aestuarianus]CAH8239896.1 conserved hypothetical protein [Vibrio aestuarianus]
MKPELFDKMLKRIFDGDYSSDKLQVLYANAEKQGDEQGRKLMAHIVNYSQYQDTVLYKKLVPESDVKRKQFMEDEGFTCANWLWSWSFVNHEKKVIAFGAWNTAYVDENNVVILCESWKGKEREALGYSQALKHIDLVENEGYSYQVFNMIHGGHDSNGRSKIAGIDPVLRNATVRKEGVDWIATVSQ